MGVVFDSKFSFNDHITEIVSSASRLMGYFVRNWSSYSNLECMKILYCAFIRSKLEYASLIWYPIYQNSILKIESVQRRALKYWYFKCSGQYPERGFDHGILLDFFGIETLKIRRDTHAVTFLYKLLNNKIDCSPLLSKVNFHVPRIESRHSVTFYCDVPHTNVMCRSPVHVMCAIFNSICNKSDIFYDSIDNLILFLREN